MPRSAYVFGLLAVLVLAAVVIGAIAWQFAPAIGMIGHPQSVEVSDRSHIELVVERTPLVSVSMLDVTDSDIEAIAGRNRVRNLEIAHGHLLTDRAMAILALESELVSLELHEAVLADASFARMRAWSALVVLDLSGCRGLSTKAMSELSKSTSIEYLEINDTDIDDSGILELARMKQLRRLEIKKCASLTVEGTKRLREGRSNLKIIVD